MMTTPNPTNESNASMKSANDQIPGIALDAATIITANPKNEHKHAETVARAVNAAGGNPADLQVVTEELSKLVPFGSKHLRKLYRDFLRSTLISDTATALFGLLAGDPAADVVGIGRLIHGVVESPLFRGASPTDAVAPLVEHLETVGTSTSPNELLNYYDAYRTWVTGGVELEKLIPSRLSPTVLFDLSRLTQNRMPWVAQKLILKAAKEIVRFQLQGSRITERITKLDNQVETKEPLVFAAWHYPTKIARPAKSSRKQMVDNVIPFSTQSTPTTAINH